MAEPARVADARELRELEPYPVTRELGDDAALTDHLLSPLWTRSRVWWILFAISGLLALLFIVSATYTIDYKLSDFSVGGVVVQKGYELNDRLLRAAKVLVARGDGP